MSKYPTASRRRRGFYYLKRTWTEGYSVTSDQSSYILHFCLLLPVSHIPKLFSRKMRRMDPSNYLQALALIVIIATDSATVIANALCYFPGGHVASTYQPCEDVSTGGETYCCELSTSVCTSGGYCVGNAATFYRGGCTDPSWVSDKCPSLCARGECFRKASRPRIAKSSPVVTDSFANFYSCNPGQFSHDNWVCGNPSQPFTDFCNTTTFSFDPGEPFVPQEQTVVGASTTFSTAQSTTTVTVQGTTTVTAQSTATVSPSEPSNGRTSCPSQNGTIIGAAVGVGLGMGSLLFAGILYLILGERKKRKSADRVAAQQPMAGSLVNGTQRDARSLMVAEADSQPVQ